MGELITCKECGTRYDSGHDAFCPRCGSTARGDVLNAAVSLARLRDPGRRRVQGSGALLLIVGVLFLVSSLVGLSVPVGEVAKRFEEPMANQPGGRLVLVPPTQDPFDVAIVDLEGGSIGNATGHVGEFAVDSPDHATMKVTWTPSNGTARNGTVIVTAGDTLRLHANDLSPRDIAVGPTLSRTVEVGRIVFIVVAALLIGGGLCAILLRAWPIAVVAAVLGVLLAAIVLVGFLVAGLLFAVPFGFAAYFILRGRRYFQNRGQ